MHDLRRTFTTAMTLLNVHAFTIAHCRRRFKSEPPRRPNIEPGVEADFGIVGCG
jgi:hypothetical protein